MRTGPVPLLSNHVLEIEPSGVASLWQRHARAGWPELPGGGTLRRVYGRSSLTIHAPAPDPSTTSSGVEPKYVTLYEVGLPMRSVASVSLTWLEAGDAQAENKGGWVIGSPLRIVPYMPRWPGFIVNTAFYATVLWLLILSPAAFRWLTSSCRAGES